MLSVISANEQMCFSQKPPALSKEKNKLAHSYDLLSHNYTEMCFNYKSRISKWEKVNVIIRQGYLTSQKHHDAFIVIYDLYIEHQHEY